MKIIRAVAILVGAGLAGASAHTLTMNAGGYGQPAAVTIIALALGVVTGAVCIGASAGHGRVALAWAIAIAMLAGEGYSLVGTAERVVATREAQQAPFKAAADRHAMALTELQAAEAATPRPASQERLTAAARAQAQAAEAARAKAAEMGCKANCAALLQAAVDAASREVSAARDEMTAHEAREARRIADRIAAARAALDNAPAPASASPLADRLGVAPWVLDLAQAALLSVGLNGLAAVLIAFGAHGRTVAATTHKPVAQIPVEDENVVAMPKPAADLITRFLLERIERAPRSRIDVVNLYSAYCAWCKDRGAVPLAAARFADALEPILEAAGIGRTARGDNVFLTGVRLAS